MGSKGGLNGLFEDYLSFDLYYHTENDFGYGETDIRVSFCKFNLLQIMLATQKLCSAFCNNFCVRYFLIAIYFYQAWPEENLSSSSFAQNSLWILLKLLCLIMIYAFQVKRNHQVEKTSERHWSNKKVHKIWTNYFPIKFSVLPLAIIDPRHFNASCWFMR